MAMRSKSTADSRTSSMPAKQSRGSRQDKPNDSRPLAKSSDPAYMKFTTYVRKATHLGVKTRLVSKEKELSDLVEELLSKWLKENDSITT
jgi:hypothetical protein